MSELPTLTRRDVVKSTGTMIAASALAGVSVPTVHAGENNTIDVALIGCGGRGTGAALNALSTKSGPIRLTAMADAFKDRLSGSYGELKRRVTEEERLAVKDEFKFVGYDAFKNAMDVLKPGDVVIFATPPAFRWPFFEYAIKKKLNIFMEKPIAVDSPSARKMLALADVSEKAGQKVGVGLMCRHCESRKELFKRIKDGEIGDLTMLRAYRMAGPTGLAFAKKKPEGMNELEYQIRNFHAFLWASGGAFSDFLIHNIDECCWMKDAWPVKADGKGGRHYRGEYVDQNFDTYCVEYTFADGAKLYLDGRTVVGGRQQFSSFAHGTKGSAVISFSGHAPSRSKMYKNQDMKTENIIWRCPQKEPDPYQLEWDNLIQSIRDDKPHNEVRRGAMASLVTAMGRLASHTAQEVKLEDYMKHDENLAPNVDTLTEKSPAPVLADANGIYPVPQPGKLKNREY
ncbi:MAG TPA: Gfo/Idh/MocA family oxidoreductase [Gemmatales bacterium]|nr:Gfo/Idh/MocA family oxidoreductase [Gemmatales bacterium]